MDTDTFKKFVEDSKKTHGWKRIQWKTVTKEYLTRLKHPADENTKDLREKLKKRYRKNKSEVVVTGKKSTEEQIAERQAAAAADGTLIDLTKEKVVRVVDSKGRPLKVGDLVRYVGYSAETFEENGEDMDGVITEIQEDGGVTVLWKETGQNAECDPDDCEKILTKEEKADEIRAVFSATNSYSAGAAYSAVAEVFRRNNLMIEQDLSIRDVVTKELVTKLFKYSGPVTFPVSKSHLFEEWDIEVDYPIMNGYVELGSKTFYYEFGGEYGDFTPDDALHYIDTKEQAEDWNMGNNWYPPKIDEIKIDFGNYAVKVEGEGATYVEGEIRLYHTYIQSGTEDVTLNIEVSEARPYYNWLRNKLFKADTVEQYEEAIADGAHVGMLHGGCNVFIRACERRRFELIDHILNAHPELLNSVDREGDTGLAWAAYKGNHGVLKKLLEYPDLDVNHKNRRGSTAFMEAFSLKTLPTASTLSTDKRTNGIVTRGLFISFPALTNQWPGRQGVNTEDPISLEAPIKVPVRCLSCRRLFEARGLYTHLQRNNRCPLCRKPMNTLEYLTDFQIQRWNMMVTVTLKEEEKMTAARKKRDAAQKEMDAAQKTIDENALKNRFRQFVVKEW